ncbi:hypothetical protein ACJ6WE_30665 [Streptomyces sp. MMS24-I31]|uniref:hypothetical protein n=1 Tax=Streptomyces sp. MMS24-I31 TaxID=3351563 RepID=UPI003896A36A
MHWSWVTMHIVTREGDRRTGIGVLRAVHTAGSPEAAHMGGGADWFMDHRIADGSQGQMCGNGIRVLARYLVDAGHCPPGTLALPPAGIRLAHLDHRTAGFGGRVTVGMGRPRRPGPDLIWSALPDCSTRYLRIRRRSTPSPCQQSGPRFFEDAVDVDETLAPWTGGTDRALLRPDAVRHGHHRHPAQVDRGVLQRQRRGRLRIGHGTRRAGHNQSGATARRRRFDGVSGRPQRIDDRLPVTFPS